MKNYPASNELKNAIFYSFMYSLLLKDLTIINFPHHALGHTQQQQ